MAKKKGRAILYPKEIERALTDDPITTKLPKQEQTLKRNKLEQRRLELLEEEKALRLEEQTPLKDEGE